MIPQITMIILVFINLLLNAYQHGKEKEGKNNFWAAMISTLIIQTILIYGGFYDNLFK